jgi:hypothetical protein
VVWRFYVGLGVIAVQRGEIVRGTNLAKLASMSSKLALSRCFSPSMLERWRDAWCKS